MSSFDYLHDGAPEIVVRLRAIVHDQNLHGLALFMASTAAVVLFAWALESAHLREAQRSLQQARQQLDRISLKAARVKAELRALHQAAILERQLYSIRISGTRTANRIAQLALRLPMNSWLTLLQLSGSNGTIDGQALGLEGVGEVLTAVPGRLMDIDASGASDRVVEFQLDLPQK